MKIDQILPIKTLKFIMAQENHSQIATVITDHNPLILKIFAEDHEIDEVYRTIH